jgi:hypothetical protein
MISDVKLKPLTKEQHDIVQQYYKKYWGKKINLRWHQYYYSINNEFTPKYIPVVLYYSEIVPFFNDLSMSKAYADKNLTDRLFPDVLQPRTIIKNINGYFYSNHSPVNRNKAIEICQNLPDAVIKAAIDSAQGKSVIRFSATNGITNRDGKSVKELFDLYKKNYIVQEAIQQHPILSSLNPTSLNTIRLTTFRKKEDAVVLTSLLRMGRKNATVDNVSAGGIYCEIDRDGKMKKFAYSIKPTGVYEKNDFGLPFEGIQIPRFKQIIEQAQKMHLVLPYTGIIGWDFTINDKEEVVLIEMNMNSPGVYQLIGPALGDYTDEILNSIREKSFG